MGKTKWKLMNSSIPAKRINWDTATQEDLPKLVAQSRLEGQWWQS